MDKQFLTEQLEGKLNLLSKYGNIAFEAYEVGDTETQREYNKITLEVAEEIERLEKRISLL